MHDLALNLARLDPKKKRLLEAALRRKGIDPLSLPIVPRPPSESAVPLGPTQERLWIQDRLEGGGSAYNEPYRADVEGPFDPDRFERVLLRLLERHETLRSSVGEHEGRPVQVIHPPTAEVPVDDLVSLSPAEREARIGFIENEIATQPFDLARGPLLRARILRLEPSRHRILFVIHHIVCDAASIVRIASELSVLYDADAAGIEADLPALPIQYADYVTWQLGLQLPSLLETQVGYWQEKLKDFPTFLALPTDRPRSPVPHFSGRRISRNLPATLLPSLEELGRRAGTTLFMTLLAGFGALLSRYSGQSKVIVGSPVDGRNRSELENLVGFFVNTLAMTVDLSGDPTGRELLQQTRSSTLAAFANQDVPFATLVQRLRPERSLGHAPLIQVMFVVQRKAASIGKAGGFALGLERIDNATSKFDLTAVLRETSSGLDCAFEYADHLFDAATIEQMIEHYARLLAGLAAAPEQKVSWLPLLTTDEERFFGKGLRRPLEETTFDRLFAARVAADPDATAVICGDQTISYGTLDRQANRLARQLQKLGAGIETPIGLAVEPGPEMILGVIAILKAGGAYVPLDPAYPRKRLEGLIADAAPPILLTQQHLVEKLPLPPDMLVICLDRDAATWPADENAPPALSLPDSAAYLIFTSGSTGRPKGAVIHHRSLVNLSRNFVKAFEITPASRILMLLSLSFDASVGDVFPTLLAGATLVLHSGPMPLAGNLLERVIERHHISVLELSASFWQQWVEDLAHRGAPFPASLSTVVTGGDSITLEKVRTFFALAAAETRLLHNYGPTEATVCTTSLAVDRRLAEKFSRPRLTIGTVLPNAVVYLVDPAGQLNPVNVPGELLIGGAGVARGYLDRPAATAAAFVPDPWSAEPGARLYRSGDLARWLADGQLEFLGRIDHQVKIRGFRIEPGEIEAVLGEHPELAEVAILAQTSQAGGGKRLVAYYAPIVGARPSQGALRAFLAERLPEHMVPSHFVALDQLPLNTHGKIDRAALPALNQERPELATDFVAPATETERRIAAIWQEFLEVERVGVDDNFFELGGHSLLLIQLHRRLMEAFERPDLEMASLLRNPSVGSLAALLAEEPSTTVAAGRQSAGPEPTRSVAVAIVGMAGRFPGANDVETFWNNICEGIESLTTFEDASLVAAGFSDEQLADENVVKVKGILDGAELFDASFFGFTPREAEFLDPQHRHALEVAFEALEHAGHDPRRHPGAIGVFAGVGRNSYLFSNLWGHPELLRSAGIAQAMLGNEKDFLPTRVSYKLGLRGPSLAVQSACSTSLVAVHFACRSLLDHECDMALAGGVTIPCPQASPYFHEPGGIFSPDGHCRPFSADAAGTVPGSGAAMVVLRRLEDALEDGDTIHAVIRGSGISNDGDLKVGYSAPGVDGQKRAILKAWKNAGIDPASIGLIEAHGTGTALGDVIEMEALAEASRAAGVDRRQTPCAIGSVKGNIGHLDTAAGAAGLIKATLAVSRGILPPTLHAEHPNPALHLAERGFELLSQRRAWIVPDGHPRRAGISSFGLGGTNVHLVIEEAPSPGPTATDRPCQLLVLSAKSAVALDDATRKMADFLENEEKTGLADVAYTLQIGRGAFAHRRVAVVSGKSEAIEVLRGENPRQLASAQTDYRRRTVAFLFPGQGAQYVGMGRELYAAEQVYREAVDRCAEVLAPHLEINLRELLNADPGNEAAASRLAETRLTQPALFTVGWALTQLAASWGIRPSALLGHSVGELLAATVAGVFELADGLRLVAERARLMQTAPRGDMLGVSLSVEKLQPFLKNHPHVELAAINAPELVSVSGPDSAIAALAKSLETAGISCRPLKVSHAFHSASMDGVAAEFTTIVAATLRKAPSIPFLSNLTGNWITPEEAQSPAYWGRQLRAVVRFDDGLTALLSRDASALLEVGPGQTLATLARQRGTREVATLLPHPKQLQPEQPFALRALGDLWLAGVEIDWLAFHGDRRRRRVPLPTYCFQRRRFWIDPPAAVGSSTTTPSRLAAGADQPADDHLEEAPSKANARALLIGHHPRPLLSVAYSAARNPRESQLVAVWEDLFGISPIGVDDDFFELGGHSLLGVRLMAEVSSRLGKTLSLETLFGAPTISLLAALASQTLESHTGDSERAGVKARAIGQVTHTAPVPISFVQEEYVAALYGEDPSGHPYKASAVYRSHGPIDPEALRLALDIVVARHEILRTTFPTLNGRRIQQIHPPSEQPLPIVDLRELHRDAQEAEIRRLTLEQYQEPWDPARGPFLRFLLARCGEDDWVLMRNLHRVIYDGQASAILMNELMTLYRDHLAGVATKMDDVELHYGDFAVWQHLQMEAGAFRSQRDYWRQALADVAPTLALVTDHPRPAVMTSRGARLGVGLSAETAAALAGIGRIRGASMFMTLITLYFPLLYRWSGGQQDLVTITPISLRQPETENTVGRFLVPLPLRIDISGNPSFDTLLERVKSAALGGYANKDLPFSQILEAAGIPVNPGYRPLGQVAFIAQEIVSSPFVLGDTLLEPIFIDRETCDYDLNLTLVQEDGGEYAGFLEYNADLFNAATAGRMVAEFEALAAAVVSESGQRLDALMTILDHHQPVKT